MISMSFVQIKVAFGQKVQKKIKYVCSKLLNCASNVQNKKKLRWN